MKMSIIEPSQPTAHARGTEAMAICVAGLLLGCSVSALIALTAFNLLSDGVGLPLVGLSFFAYALGLWLPGPLNAYLVECFYRKRLFYGATVVLVASGMASGLTESLPGVFLLRLVQGGAAGVALLALGTLVNDLSVSSLRTRADAALSWFRRVALPLGLGGGWWLTDVVGSHGLTYVWALMPAICAMAVVAFVRVSFKAPLHQRRFSLDRFWLSQAWPLTLNMFPVAVVAGMVIASESSPIYYMYMAGGCLFGMWCEHVVLVNADERAQLSTGLLLTAAGVLLCTQENGTAVTLSMFLLGAGLSQTVARFLLYYLKLPGHCQRATAQHTYLLVLDTGLAVGYWAGCSGLPFTVGSLLLVAFSLALYLGLTHKWFVKHRDRGFRFREI